MRSLAVRLALLGLFVMAGCAAAYFVWTGETHVRQSIGDARVFESTALEVERGVLDLRAAQVSYVAAGQGEEYWTGKVATATISLKEVVEELRARAMSTDARSSIDSARSGLDDFERLDRRVREYVHSGQTLLASDLIFTDGLEITGGISASVARARTAEATAHGVRVAGTRRTEAISVGTAGLVALAVISLLIPRQAPSLDREVDAERSEADRSSEYVREFTTPSASVAPIPPLEPRVDFSTIASVCSDLARVVDTRPLPALLGRAAGVLDASGVVLWIADPDGRELTPIVTHGYPQPMVLRLGTILRDAENATAAAFRTSLLQTVAADAVSNGAIAAPLVTPAGCVGVMAAEVRRHAEADSARLAAATIVAAQLATLVGPPSTRAQARADAG